MPTMPGYEPILPGFHRKLPKCFLNNPIFFPRLPDGKEQPLSFAIVGDPHVYSLKDLNSDWNHIGDIPLAFSDPDGDGVLNGSAVLLADKGINLNGSFRKGYEYGKEQTYLDELGFEFAGGKKVKVNTDGTAIIKHPDGREEVLSDFDEHVLYQNPYDPTDRVIIQRNDAATGGVTITSKEYVQEIVPSYGSNGKAERYTKEGGKAGEKSDDHLNMFISANPENKDKNGNALSVWADKQKPGGMIGEKFLYREDQLKPDAEGHLALNFDILDYLFRNLFGNLGSSNPIDFIYKGTPGSTEPKT